MNIYFLPNKQPYCCPKKQEFCQNQMKFPNFVNPSADTSPKIGHDFSNEKVQKWKLSKKHFSKKCVPKLVFFIEKKSM